MAARAELLRPGFSGLGAISGVAWAAEGANTGATAAIFGLPLILAVLVVLSLLATAWAGAFAAAFSNGLVNVFVTGEIGLAVALMGIGAALAAACLLAAGAALFFGMGLAIGLAFTL